jgi:uncharacterized membrane protein YgdD (TMEM256/DUF423 family)
MRILRAAGPLFVFLGIVLGGVGSHLLRSKITPEDLMIFDKGVLYQLINGVALFALTSRRTFPVIPVIILAAGIILFSGGLYSRALLGVGGFSQVAPIGGSILMLGWLWLSATALSSASVTSENTE